MFILIRYRCLSEYILVITFCSPFRASNTQHDFTPNNVLQTEYAYHHETKQEDDTMKQNNDPTTNGLTRPKRRTLKFDVQFYRKPDGILKPGQKFNITCTAAIHENHNVKKLTFFT